MSRTIRIATRKSALAMWQAEYVQAELRKHHPGLEVVLVPLVSRGDKILDVPLAKVGGKGLFVKELEQALLDGSADIAVHSMKDVPMVFPEGLDLAAICPREDPRDALVSNRWNSLNELPEGAVVGTSSMRRQCQLLAKRPDLQIQFLRGNVNTRLQKLDEGHFDAIILAAAGLKRLQLEHRITERIAPEYCLPAGGQGAVGIESRNADNTVLELLQPLHCETTAEQVLAERAMNRRLQGGCQVPIAAMAVHESAHELWLRGLVGEPDGSTILEDHVRGSVADADALGVELAEKLLAAGAGEILATLYDAGDEI